MQVWVWFLCCFWNSDLPYLFISEHLSIRFTLRAYVQQTLVYSLHIHVVDWDRIWTQERPGDRLLPITESWPLNELDPGFRWVQTSFCIVGEVYANTGRHAEAEHWFRKALEAKPDHIPAHLTMAKLYHKMVNFHAITASHCLPLIVIFSRKKASQTDCPSCSVYPAGLHVTSYMLLNGNDRWQLHQLATNIGVLV